MLHFRTCCILCEPWPLRRIHCVLWQSWQSWACMATYEASRSRWHGDNACGCNAPSRACTYFMMPPPTSWRKSPPLRATHSRCIFLWLVHSSMRVPTKLISAGCQSSFNELEKCRARVAVTGQGSCVPESRMRALCIETQVSRASPEALRVTGCMRATNVVLARYRGGACKPLPDECCLPYQALACSEQQQIYKPSEQSH